MGYYEDTDLNLSYYLATTFGTSDRWFSPVMDRTQINRAYIYAATSQGYAYPPGQGIGDNQAFSAKTIFEAMEEATPKLTWTIYVDPTNAFYNGVNCATAAAGQAQDLCLAGVSYMNQFDYESQIQDPSTGLWAHFAPISQFATDLQNESTFPDFAMIEPPSSAGLDEHPSDSDLSPVNVQLGEKFMQQQVLTPFMQSPTWADSALILTYDEAGGLYDHVSPQPATPPGDFLSPFDLNPASNDICTGTGQLGQGTCTFGWTGYRVPLIVISPYSVPNFVSHTVRDTTAVLKMVETRFVLPQLTNRDGTEAPMDEFFDFVNKPYATPPTNVPTQSTTGICDQTPATGWNEPPELTVTVNPTVNGVVTGTGTGQVSSSPSSGILNCGTECTGVFATGTMVTLTATPNSGSTFTGWGGECTGTITTTCTITVGTHDYVTAVFNP
jgi:phospholipase C